MDKRYIAFVGGTETYGRFIEKPFPDLVETATGLPSVNFGCLNAGIDVFAHDPFVPGAAAAAKVTVMQVMGAQNMTNRFYSVHPRRNDRFVAPSDLLKTIFREVDFSEFHFTRHMLQALKQVSPERFETVQRELQSAWVARMRLMMGQMRGKTILLWFANHVPSDCEDPNGSLGQDPLFVTRSMVDQVASYGTKGVEILPSPLAQSDGTNGMKFNALEAHVAAELPGVRAHEEVADALVRELAGMI